MDIIKILASEFSVREEQINNTVALIDDGNTIPFIARYRKEVTGSLDDAVLRDLNSRLAYLRSLEERKAEIIKLIDEQGKMTDELMEKINSVSVLSELEDIYRPYRPKRRTRASVAKEKGLEPLAIKFMLQAEKSGNVYDIASEFINPDLGVETAEEAVAGASDIIAENISDDADWRKYIRGYIFKNGIISSKGDEEKDSVYTMYYDFSQSIKDIAGHRVLAMNRGEKEDFLKVSISTDDEAICAHLCKNIIKGSIYDEILKNAIEDSYKRLIFPSVEREIRNELTEKAEASAMVLFSKNLYQLLMQPPFKNLNVLGIDPGYRTGCKVAVVDETGKVCDTAVIFCTLTHHDKAKSANIVKSLIKKYNVDLIAIGNGTASKESEIFVAELIKELDKPVHYAMVNEAGASVYSASKLASEEFPDFTVEQRSAASIARRIQDPLAELVKIDPKSIGVGQYQHDMNQKELGIALGGVVENCVNSVGVDLNTASAPLLSYVAGISSAVAKNIVTYREQNGKFTNRNQLKKVSKLGDKAFTQCAGFLRITDGDNVFDSTSVHPESYGACADLLSELGYTPEDVKCGGITDIRSKAAAMDKQSFAARHNVGLPTINDIIDSLEKPGRDPRDSMPKPELKSDIMSMEDLSVGMVLSGTVRNVIDFGAFVDIGVHQDGLVHISEISDRYIKHPTDALAVGDVVKVKIIAVDTAKHRISLSIKQAK
ncbi:MAG: RNA-binding transcriptional accessory protein [Clostridia bacterium]|nr:RNA-binding transcriptional accessory protein [Clostridia bacterium]